MRTCPPLLLAALSFGLIALSACAGDAAYRPDPDSGRETLFISPAGKPFYGAAGAPYPVGVWFAEADANHDGRLTKEEMRADFSHFFDVLDVDHNGVIDGIETARYEEEIAPEVLPRLAQVGGGFPGERSGGRRGATRRLAEAPVRKGQAGYDGAPFYSLLNVSEPVSSADQNFDGKINIEEYIAAADRRFDQLDTEKLGYLTLPGLPQTPQQILIEGRRKK